MTGKQLADLRSAMEELAGVTMDADRAIDKQTAETFDIPRVRREITSIVTEASNVLTMLREIENS